MSSNETNCIVSKGLSGKMYRLLGMSREAVQKLKIAVSTYLKIKFNFHFNIFLVRKLKEKKRKGRETKPILGNYYGVFLYFLPGFLRDGLQSLFIYQAHG